MKIKIEIGNIVYEATCDGFENGCTFGSEASLNGEVYIEEDGLKMPMLSEDDRILLINHIRDGITDFVSKKLEIGLEWD